ncbi:MAG: DUF3488 and transglutaminase-like domain-containing protein [Actinomycetota bacterium]|nr:DUF3488 and transglutaminase-like domain-containing protein [Actinomycetota bacterium]
MFGEGPYRGVALLGMGVAWGLALGARRLGAGSLLTLAISIAALFWYVVAIFQTDRTFYLFPSGAAVRGLARSLAFALEKSSVDYAPVPVRPGYVISIVAGMWIAAALGEVATFRWRRPLIATLLPLVLFAVILIVGTGHNAWLVVVLFISALLTFWGLESAHRMRSWGRWIPVWAGHTEEAPESVTGTIGRRMAASCIAAALVAPVFLPALEDGLLSWRSGDGPGDGPGIGAASARIDPLVSIVPGLLRQTDRELMRVTADEASYWRLVTLRDFDGISWTPPAPRPQTMVGGAVPPLGVPPVAISRPLRQRFTITGLEGESLPSAGYPSEVLVTAGGTNVDLLVDLETADLRLKGGLSEGVTYEVEAQVAGVSYADLRNASIGDLGRSLGPLYQQVPQGVYAPSDEVRALLSEWTADARTDYEELVAIQNHLRGFDYSLDVETSASTDYLTTFLTETRAGYCQQFATAFALLARLKGFPARVAVGFLPGETDLSTPDQFIVRGSDTHAWPEVYFEDYGWIPFEPTPRSEVSAPVYTTRAVAPVRGGGRPAGGPRGVGGRGNLNDPGLQPDEVAIPDPAAEAAADPERERATAAWELRFARIRTAVVIAVVAFLALVPLLKGLRVNRRYARARATGVANATAAAAFAHFEEEAAELAVPRVPSESATHYAGRLAGLHHVPERWARRLAGIYEAAEYGRAPVPMDDAEEARLLALELKGRLWKSASWWKRAARLFSPKRLGLPALLNRL